MSILPTIGNLFENRYQIESILGTGGNGTVYKALQIDCKRTVALKVLNERISASVDHRSRFMREAQALSKLSHLNIVAVYHMGISADSSLPYIVMEYVRGESLRQAISSPTKLEAVRALRLIREAALAMNFVHEQGWIHRDLKPENILISKEAALDTVKIVDFGLTRPAQNEDSSLTGPGKLVGSPRYMSPEQCKGKKLDFHTDIYSLTACLFESITGEAPYQAENAMGYIYKHLSEAVPVINFSVHGELFNQKLNELVNCGMAKVPADRFGSMKELSDKLDELLILSESDSKGKSFSLKGLLPLAAIALAICVGLSTFLILSSNQSRDVRHNPVHIKASAQEDSREQIHQREQFLKKAVQAADTSYGPESTQAEQALFELGNFYLEQANAELALPAFQRLTSIQEKTSSKSLCKGLNGLAMCYELLQKNVKAEEIWRRVIAMTEKDPSTNNEDLPEALFYLGTATFDYNPTEALGMFRRSLAGAEIILRADRIDPDNLNESILKNCSSRDNHCLFIVASDLKNMAALDFILGEEQQTENDSRRFFSLNDKMHIYEGPRLIAPLRLAEYVSDTLDKREQAFRYAFKVTNLELSLSRDSLPAHGIKDNRELAVALNGVDPHVQVLKHALANAEKLHGSNSEYLEAPLKELGEYYALHWEFKEAVPVLKRLVAIAENSKDDREMLLASLALLANCYVTTRQTLELEKVQRQVLQIHENSPVRDESQIMKSQCFLAMACSGTKRKEALTLLNQSMAICEERLKLVHIDLPELTPVSFANLPNQDKDHLVILTQDLEEIAKIEAISQPQQALKLLKRSYELDKSVKLFNRGRRIVVLYRIAQLDLKLGMGAEASSYLQEAGSNSQEARGVASN